MRSVLILQIPAKAGILLFRIVIKINVVKRTITTYRL